MTDKPQREAVMFDCCGDRLVGVLERPMQEIAKRGAVALFVVGGPQYRVGSHGLYSHMAAVINRAGIATLRFDVRGMGDSEGNSRQYYNIDEDISSAVNYLQKINLQNPVLIGLCDGATAVVKYTIANKVSGGMILINPWLKSEQAEAKAFIKSYYIKKLLNTGYWKRLITGKTNPVISICSFIKNLSVSSGIRAKQTSNKKNSDKIDERAFFKALASYKGNILIILSENDLTAKRFEILLAKYKNDISKENIEITYIKSADHTFSRKDHSVYLGNVICNYFS